MSEIITVERQISMEYLLESKVALYALIFPYYFTGKDAGRYINLDRIRIESATGKKTLSKIELEKIPCSISACLSVCDLLAIQSHISDEAFIKRWGKETELIGWKSATVCWDTGECWVPSLRIRNEVEVAWQIFHSSREPNFSWLEEYQKTAFVPK